VKKRPSSASTTRCRNALTVWTIVVAAGRGDRYGAAKQFESFRGRTLLDWATDAARRSSDDVVVVLPPGEGGVAGGATRSESVRAGLAAVPDTADIIVVHDAARPLATDALFAAVIDAVRNGADAAIPGVAVTDTVKRVEGERVIETLDRSQLVAVQTPQAFRADALRKAHGVGGDATDDAALVEAAGGTVVVVPGEPGNIKVTTPADLRVAEALSS
jgi:2-C-methyl-D-erythritol 4-phosphate cytidylyltransferase